MRARRVVESDEEEEDLFGDADDSSNDEDSLDTTRAPLGGARRMVEDSLAALQKSYDVAHAKDVELSNASEEAGKKERDYEGLYHEMIPKEVLEDKDTYQSAKSAADRAAREVEAAKASAARAKAAREAAAAFLRDARTALQSVAKVQSLRKSEKVNAAFVAATDMENRASDLQSECDDDLGRATLAETAARAKLVKLAAKRDQAHARWTAGEADYDQVVTDAAKEHERAKARSATQSSIARGALARLNEYRGQADTWKQDGYRNATPNDRFVATKKIYVVTEQGKGGWIELAYPWERAPNALVAPPLPYRPPQAQPPRLVNDDDSSDDERRPPPRRRANDPNDPAVQAKRQKPKPKVVNDNDSSDDDDVVMVGQRTWKERDNEARRKAVDLTSPRATNSCVDEVFRKFGL
jgi:hypothetical protein